MTYLDKLLERVEKSVSNPKNSDPEIARLFLCFLNRKGYGPDFMNDLMMLIIKYRPDFRLKMKLSIRISLPVSRSAKEFCEITASCFYAMSILSDAYSKYCKP